jgi:excisionase family DNA binding protein
MTTTTATLTINLTGTLTLDTNTLRQLVSELQIKSPDNQTPAVAPARQTKLVYNVTETAELLGVSNGTVYRLIARRMLKTCGALRKIIISHEEIERFIKATTGRYQ